MSDTPTGASIPEITHHHTVVSDLDLHYVSGGSGGTPILLVHGFPETWWAFHKLIPLLAAEHRVIAVDLPGFGDSGDAPEDSTSETVAETVRGLIEELDIGAVHLTGQDISGVTSFRLAARYPELVRSFAAIETGLPGFGLETFADVTRGGAWHIGVLAAPGIPEMLLGGREREFLEGYAYPAMCSTPCAITEQDIDEFTRTFARPGGFRGASNLYRSMLREGEEVRELAAASRLQMPVLAVGAGSGDFAYQTMTKVAEHVTAARLDGAGHFAAMEAPEALALTLLEFYRGIDTRPPSAR